MPPDCVEMEGAAVSQIAGRNGVPCVILRAMSDNADESGYEVLVVKQFSIAEYVYRHRDRGTYDRTSVNSSAPGSPSGVPVRLLFPITGRAGPDILHIHHRYPRASRAAASMPCPR